MRVQIIEVDPKDCVRWKFADRSEFEFGDIFALSQDILKNGQIEPVILRKIPTTEGQYEVVTGSRRWKACLAAGIPLKGMVQDLTDEQAALAQIRENQKVPLCDFSKGIYYSKILKEMNITLTSLAQSIGCSRAKLDNYLTFEKVRSSIWEAVGNLSRVSSKSAGTIFKLSKMGEDYINALIDLADEIRKGVGCKTLEKMVMLAVNGDTETIDFQQSILLPSGQPIAKWTKNGLQFSRNIPVNQNDIANILIKYFQEEIKS